MKPMPTTVSKEPDCAPLNPPKASCFRRLVRGGVLLIVLLIGAVLALPYVLPWLLQQQGIDFNWHNPQWQLNGFSAERVQLTLPNPDAAAQQLQLDDVRITWAVQSLPIQQLQASRLKVYWPITGSDNTAHSSALSIPQSLLKWLPQHIELQTIDADLPGLGHLQGSLNLRASATGLPWQPAFIDSQLTLNNLQGAWLDTIAPEFRPNHFSAHITSHPDHKHSIDGQQLLTFDVHSTGPMRLQLNGLLDLQQTPHWQGRLKNSQLFMQLDALNHPSLQTQQLQARLYFEGQADEQQFSIGLNPHSRLEAIDLTLPDNGQADKISLELANMSVRGRSNAPYAIEIDSAFSAHIQQLRTEQLHSQDWTLNGTLSGPLQQLELTSRLSGEHGLIIASQLNLNDDATHGSASIENMRFDTSNPLQKTFTDWPQSVSLNSGQLHSTIDFNFPREAPLSVNIDLGASAIQGAIDSHYVQNLNIAFAGQLNIQPEAQWQASLSNAQLSLALDALSGPSLQTKQLRMQTALTADANHENFTLRFNNNTRLDAQAIKLSDTASAVKASLKLPELIIQGPTTAPEQANLTGPVNLHIDRLSAKQLHTQNWDFNGNLNGQLAQAQLNGTLSNQHGLTLNSHVRLLDNAMQGHATLKEVFFKAGNPLQQTLKDWPELVSFNTGRLRSRIDFTVPFSGAANLALTGSADGLSGIVNRSELKNLTFEFSAQLSDQSLVLGLPHLTIEQLNPGIPMSTIAFNKVHYHTNLNTPLQGAGNWQSIQANLLNGKVWLDAQYLDLRRQQQLLLNVEGLELQELLRVYPAEGLSGTGTIDGQLPIHIAHDTFYIEAGQLQAREPGVLQFQSEKIQALGQSNPAMRIVADALEDFHFNLLSSGLSYDQSGKLLLSVNLKGQNPDLEKGRPIHLNINLEEDIPALLASIQLSGQVSEIIQKRVRERLEKR
ncbi:hypothetical protein FXF61_02950 [Pseudomonas sp. C27(2019)]|uniref:intermembrane phospholipid transport protein YdbH family protein n=1 Tax=Pseudomonas sp. C27(2019) TaxID=2604941 RepID=UPI0012477796|nr:YdbH domain-containing protein [Pseudomonas sp. C27(2019)]QEY58201.1 hypothetical protein FXF61_02950 [Pseudomonas sp. C27(2019)]